MKTVKPVKCISDRYESEPFYLIQYKYRNGIDYRDLDTRYIAWFRNKATIKSFLKDFSNKTNKELQVRITDLANIDSPVSYEGFVAKSTLIDVLEEHAETIFHDGYHELMIKIAESGDYIVFDEHGLIYLYTLYNYRDILSDYKLKYKPDGKFIDQQEHGHYSPANRQSLIKLLINTLELTWDKG